MQFSQLKEKAKNKGFWAGILTAVGAFLGGSLAWPDFIVEIIRHIGG